MASIAVLGTSVLNTTAGNKTITATPTNGDLIVIIAVATGVTTTVADNATGGTYTQVDSTRTGFSTSGNLQVFVRNALVTGAASTIYTATQTSSTGGGLVILRVTGMAAVGASAVRSNGGQSTIAAGTPAPVLSLTPLSSNPIITAMANSTNSSTTNVVQRTGYTEDFDNGYNTPATGLEVSHLDSGETSATITYAGATASTFASFAIELNAPLTVSVSESVSITEALDVLRAGARNVSVSDNLAVTESIILIDDLRVAVSDSLTVTESKTVAFQNFPPTVALNSPADTATGISTTPDLAFTGTDSNGDAIEYNVQIDKDINFGAVIDSQLVRTTDVPFFGGTALSGQNTQAVGQTFTTTQAYSLKYIELYLAKSGSPTDNIFCEIYNAVNGTLLGTTDSLSLSTITVNNFNRFTLPTAIALANATQYFLVAKRDGAFDTTNCPDWGLSSSSSYSGGDKYFLNNQVWSAPSATQDHVFKLYADSSLLNKLSVTSDATFTDVTNGGNTHPFPSGEQVKYTVQAGDALSTLTYYWRVEGSDPSGSNTFGAWSSIRSFTVSAGAADLSISVSDSITLSESNDQLRAGGRDLSASESISLSENTVVRLEMFIAKSESVSLSESNAELLLSFASVSDAETVTDSVLRILEALISQSDSLSLSESVAEFVTPIFVNVSDSLSITEAVTLRQDSFISKSDSLDITESVNTLALAFTAISDSLAVTDSTTELLLAFVNVSDTEAITDSVSVSFGTATTLSISVSDSLSITDSVFMQELSFVSKSDSVTMTESNLELIPTLFLSVNDSLTITDSNSQQIGVAITVSDSLSLSESLKLILEAIISTSDTESITDTTSRVLEAFINKSDSISLSEALTQRLDANIAKSDSQVITDSTVELIPSLFITVSDSLNITESSNVVEPGNGINVNDSITITEARTLLIPTLFLNVSDSITITDTTNELVSIQINVSDLLVITDTVNLLIPSLLLAVSDSLNITESVSRMLESFVSKSDSLAVTDTINALIPQMFIQVSDSIAISESVSLSRNPLLASVSDSLAITDAVSLLEGISVNKSDSLTITENVQVTFQVSLAPLDLSVIDSLVISDLANAVKAYSSTHDSLEDITALGGIAVGGNSDSEPINTTIGVAVTAASDSLENPTAGVSVSGAGDSLETATTVAGSPVSGQGDSLYSVDSNTGAPAISDSDSGY